MTNHRLIRLYDAMRNHNVDAVALIPGRSLFYLTGLSFHLMERPVIGIFPLDEPPCFVLPELERRKAEVSRLETTIISYQEDEASRMAAFQQAADRLNLNARRIGIEPLSMRAFELWLIAAVAPRATLLAADDILNSLRIAKEPDELEAIRRAVRIAEKALKATLPLIQIEMTERELASELVIQLLRAGSDPELPFDPIVACGPHSALPHAVPGDARLQPNQLLLIDWGARIDGYISDLTRTFALGKIDSELVKIHKIVHQANAAGQEAARAGITGHMVDQATRKVIEDKGYGQAFCHRTGHGIGLDAHEPPFIATGNNTPLTTGMTFTIEPGIYLESRGGVRIEDDIVITATGAKCFSTLPRELEVIL